MNEKASWVRILSLAAVLVALVGCSPLKIDKTFQSIGYDHRIRWVVLHYTSADFERSRYLLTQSHVSSHYLLSMPPVRIYQLVDEQYRAWHAGESQWYGRTWLNSSSIGIELVHPGYIEQDNERVWIDWSEEQIDSLVLLLKDIIQRYQLPIDSIVGHSDIAPLRKLDPGPKFPWFRLAQEGMIRWPLVEDIQYWQPVYQEQLPEALWFQQQLSALGYQILQTAEFDEATVKVLSVLQMKYRPANFTGLADAETAAILQSLVRQQAESGD